MDAVASPVEQFKDRLKAAGIAPDKPLHGVLLTVYETALEAKAAVGTGARGLSEQGERELIYRLSENALSVTSREVERFARRISFRNSFLFGLAGLLLLAGGFVWGHWNAPGRSGFLADIASGNELAPIESYCRAHIFRRDGKAACQLPNVWVKGTP